MSLRGILHMTDDEECVQGGLGFGNAVTIKTKNVRRETVTSLKSTTTQTDYP